MTYYYYFELHLYFFHAPANNAKLVQLAGWASRVYFSDNGSTAIEVALKMAFRKFSSDHGILSDIHKNENREEKCIELKVGYLLFSSFSSQIVHFLCDPYIK